MISLLLVPLQTAHEQALLIDHSTPAELDIHLEIPFAKSNGCSHKHVGTELLLGTTLS